MLIIPDVLYVIQILFLWHAFYMSHEPRRFQGSEKGVFISMIFMDVMHLGNSASPAIQRPRIM